MVNARPQLIVITPIRNEAWVLEAFLTHCSSWADHIIVANQHSTDGSREIALRFPKVTLIDNPDEEMHQANARKLLFKAVDCIAGEKIVFALDADEFLTEGFEKTDGWRRIMESQPDTIFNFRWQYLENDYAHEQEGVDSYAEWACHFSADACLSDLYSQTENRAVHEARVPCTASATYINIPDIRFIHLARLSQQRTQNKYDFYQVSTIAKLPHCPSAISIYRTYHQTPCVTLLPSSVRLTAIGNDSPLNHLVHTSDHGQHYIDEMVAIINREGTKKFEKLCIWDNPDLRAAGITYRPSPHIRLLHKYLKVTQRHSSSLPIRIIDKLLKKII